MLSLKVNQSTLNLQALIDSGCSFPVIIAERVLPKNTPINYSTAKTYTTANGNKDKTLGTTKVTIIYEGKEIVCATAHIMRTSPETLILGFPVIQKLNLKIGSNHMEAELNNKPFKINYVKKELLLASSCPISLEPLQSIYLTVDRNLKKNSLITDIESGEHLKHSYQDNTVRIVNNNTKPRTIFPETPVATINENETNQEGDLKTASHIDPAVPKKAADKYQQLIQSYSTILSKLPGKYAGETKMSVDLTTTTTFKSRIIPIPYAAQDHYKKWINSMTELGVIEKSQSPYTSTLLVVKKKDKGEFRYVLNCSSINAITKIDYWPIPKLFDIMRQMAQHKKYIVCDVSKYFDSLPLEDSCKKYFSFICPLTQQIYSFTTVVQGSRNASFHSQMILRNEVLNGIMGCVSFIDDIIIFGETHEELFQILKLVFQRFKTYNLHLQPQKLKIGLTSVNIFGFTVSEGKIKGEESRLTAISNLPYPKNKRDLFKYMGSLGYYRLVTPDYAKVSTELNKMLSMNIKFELNQTIKNAFNELKESVRNSIAISLPHEDGTMILNTDASEDSFGATLASRDNNNSADIRIIGLEGGSFLPPQRLYNIAVKELLALSRGITKFRHFLLGTEFIIKIDNSSLYHILKSPQNFIIDKTGPVSRVLLQLQEYSFEPILVKTDDVSHVLADMISRGKYLRIEKVTAKDLIQPNEVETVAKIQYFPIILSKQQLWQIIKKSYETETTHAQVQEKYKNFRGFVNLRTHCELGGSIIIPPQLEEKLLEITHLCSAKRHLWFLKSKDLWMKNLAQKIAKISLACEKCQKFIIAPIHEKFVTDKINGDYPFQVISGDFSIIKDFSKGILIFQCANTKFTFAILTSLKSEQIATAIMTCMMRYGIAGATLKLDNQFNTVIIKQMAKLMQLNIEFSTPRNSRSNSLAELAVKNVQKYLRLIAPNFENEDEIAFAIELACFLINTEIREGVDLTPIEIVYPHASFTPFALDTIEYRIDSGLDTYVSYMIERLKGIYDIGRTGDQLRPRDHDHQPLNCDDLVRIRLENTERANKLSPMYSEYIYKVQSVNRISNTYTIIRIGTEEAGIRTKRFLYHRRRLKKIHMPNETLRKFWMEFPNSSDPLKVLEEANRKKIFQHQPTQPETNEEQTDTAVTNQTDHPRELRPRKVANYNNLKKFMQQPTKK